MLSTVVKNDFEPRRKHSVIWSNGKESISLAEERVLVGYERIQQTIEHVIHGQDRFPCCDECVHFRFFP